MRARDAELFRSARERLIGHLEEQVTLGAAQQDWSAATAAARKLGDYFPEKEEVAGAWVATYTRYGSHAELIQSAEDAFSSGRFGGAREALDRIPETSPYADVAAGLITTQHKNGL